MTSETHNSATTQDQVKYRADIDGLRAVAVLAVIIFHAFPNVLRGGFVGVDIFFVISGYLITSIILNDLHHGNFTIAKFYSRRIRRIFPALFIVLATCFILGWFVLYANEFKQLTKHILGGASFSSNLIFWGEASYFDRISETKPLLHLWSLGVEEQFYIFWPLLLCLFTRRKNLFPLLLIATLTSSFILNIYFVSHDATQAFYSPITRFWELLIGSLLAYRAQVVTLPTDTLPAPHSAGLYNAGLSSTKSNFCSSQRNVILSTSGFFLVGLAALILSKGRAFPGGWALLPTLGAALIISAGPHAWPNRTLLSSRILVWIGLISYPLYLWHWPLLSFAQIMESKTPSILVRCSAVALAFLLALLTYRFIERPIRFGKTSPVKIKHLTGVMVIVGITSWVSYMQDGWPDKLPSNTQQSEQTVKWNSCPHEGKAQSYCWTLDPSIAATTVLIGDSHAGHLAVGLHDIFKANHKNISVRWGGDCLPFLQDISQKSFSSVCDQSLINKTLEDIIASSSIDTVFISSYAIAKIQARAEAMNRSEGYVNNPNSVEVTENARKFEMAMYSTFQRLLEARKKVVYFSDIPELYFDPQECFERPIEPPWHKVKSPCAISRKAFEARNSGYHKVIEKAKNQFPEIKFIDTYEYLCDEDLCHATSDGAILYKDRDHLNYDGSRFIAAKLEKNLFVE